jgi:ATP-dependent DNA helicase RecG
VQILRQTQIEQSISTLMAAIGRAKRTKFRDQVLNPLLDSGLIEMTIPDKPTSSKQRYRVAEKGRAAFAAMNEGAE